MIDQVRKIDDEYHFFNIVEEQTSDKKGRLSGVAVSVKDCINVKGMHSRAGSAILEGYKPLFDATVVQKIRDEGATIIGKTAQDAFGFGSFSINAGKGLEIPLNPFDKKRSCGGSSGGSAGITQKADFRHIALAESTGGSIVTPASFCGVIGLCPTYGRVSRYGLMDYANSLDKIGPMAKSMEDVALMMEIIAGADTYDSTSLADPVPNYTEDLKGDIKDLKVGVITTDGVDNDVQERVNQAILKLEGLGAKTQEIELPLTDKFGVSAYYMLAMCEASTNLAKYCGMRYGAADEIKGSFNNYFSKVRSANFNEESKRRIMIGTFARMAGYRDAYYIKAAKVRTKIIDEYKAAFKKVDCLVSPTMPFVAPKFPDIHNLTPFQHYAADKLTVGPNLAGLPHVSVPIGENPDGLPVGLLIIGDHMQESTIMKVGAKL